MHLFLLILFLLVVIPASARAACTSPDGSAGAITWNGSDAVIWCDGSSWYSLKSMTDARIGTLTSNKWCAANAGGTGINCTQDVPSAVPVGAIMAFDLTVCPAGWSEYTAARGRFLRGIDNGAGNDPAGTRAAGNVQADAFQGHRHAQESGNAGAASAGGVYAIDYNNYSNRIGDPITDGVNGTPRTANETRPKNVAVLFCRKN